MRVSHLSKFATAFAIFASIMFPSERGAAQSMSYLQDLRVAAKNANSQDQLNMRSHVAILTRGYLSESKFKDLVDSRIAKLHADFLNGRAPKVPELKVVDALNKMAEQFGLPEYAKTSSLEFRLFRLSTLRNIPELNPYALTHPDEFNTSTGKHVQSVSTDMNPAEIAYLVCSLVLQKRLNPHFQLTKSEAEQRFLDFQRSFSQKAPGNVVKPTSEEKSQITSPAVNASRFEAINSALSKRIRQITSEEQVTALLDSFQQELGYGN